MKPYHTVKARLKTSWFFPAIMVYDIVHTYEAWYDPSHGNGGGDYELFRKTVATYRDQEKAEAHCAQLNKFNGDKQC